MREVTFLDGEISRRLQEEISRLRTSLEPRMSGFDVWLPRPNDLPSYEDHGPPPGINDRISVMVTSVAGSIWFAYVLIALALTWISFNLYIKHMGGDAFDEPWAFPTMLLISNGIQLMMPIFIMASQKRIEKREREREKKDEILTLIGRRDVLLMFMYLSEFSQNQDQILNQMRRSQDRLEMLEKDQTLLSEDVIPDLISMIRDMSDTLRDRPCVLAGPPDHQS